ncbi:MAG: hypothetical protein R2819_00665 [Allomuricauda sp.]
MNKAFLTKILLLSFLHFFSCSKEIKSKSDYSAFEQGTDWDSKNLVGKVKSITLYKATYLGTGGVRTREPIKTFREEFTEFGSTKRTEYYDNFGNLSQTTINEFDENQFFIKSLTTHYFRPHKSLMTIEHDTINNLAIRNVIINDTINFKYIDEYDQNEQLIKQTSIENSDTIVWTAKQKFDGKNRLIFKEVLPSNDDEPQIYSYKYDTSGNIVESINGNSQMKFKSISKYKGKTLTVRTDYIISADTIEHLQEITEYDERTNPVILKIYENSELNREFKNKYLLDDRGNWIKKIVSLKEHFAGSKKFTPAYVETREIEYWK